MKRILIGLILFFNHTLIFPVVGALDTSFSGDGKVITDIGTSTIDAAYASAIQPDGKIVVVGSSGSNMAMVRYTILGALDTEFNTDGIVTQAIGTTAVAYGVAIQNDGKIVVCGTSDTDFFVARFLTNGSLDTAGFNTATGYVIQSIGTTDAAYAVAINPSNQKIIVAGLSDTKIMVAQYTTAGALDTGGFNTASGYNIALGPDGSSNIAYAVALDSSYNIVIAGLSGTDMIVARYSSAGVLDTAGFNTASGYNVQSLGGTDIGYGVAFQRNGGNAGKIIVSGTTGTNAFVARFTTAGILDSGASAFGTGGTPVGYNASNNFGGTSAIAYGVSVQEDDKIVIGGTAVNATTLSDFVIARYLANGSALDTTFNPSNGYTTTDFGTNTVDTGRTLTMQPNGRFVVAGTTDSGSNDFAAARYLGDAAPQGCMDVTYPATLTGVDIPGYRTYPTESTSTNLPKVTAMYPASGGDLYVLTSASGSTNTQLVQLDSAGATSSTAVVIAKPTPNDVITDSQNRAVVVGTTAATTTGFIARYYDNAGTMTIDGTFAGGTVVAVTDTVSLVRVCEQNSSRLVAIGQLDASTGIVIAYTESGTLDTSFGNGFGYNTENGSGSSATFNDMIIDANDGIYIVYQVAGGSTPNIWIEKFSSNGSALDDSFATDTVGQVDTGLVSASYNTPCLSFDNNGKIVLATTDISTGTIVVQSYNPTSTNAPIINSCSITTATTLLSTPVITKLQCDTNNRLIFTGYDNNDFFVGRLILSGSTYILDTTFAPYSSSPGLLKTMYDAVNPSRVSNSVCINTNGAILFGGYENIDGSNTISIVGQVVGNTGGTVYTQVNRYPGINVVGQLDTTFGTDGALDLFTSIAMPHGQAKVMNVLATNKILIADANGTDTVLARLTSAYAADGTFSGDGFVTLTGLVTPTAIMVDTTAANYYVLGVNATPRAVINKVVASDGSLAGGAFPVTTTLTSAYAIAQQASGRILVAGYDSAHSGGSGVIAAYTPAGALDTSFNPTGATPGYWYTDVASPIMAMSIGRIAAQLDRIYLVYSDGGAASLGNAVVQQLLENGTAYAPTSGTGAFTPITAGFSNTVNGNTQLRMQLDVNGKIIVVAATASTYGTTPAIKAARYPAAGGTIDVGPVSVLTGTANQVIENILTLSDGTTLILAAVPNATATSAFMSVAQLNSSFALDPTFNALVTPGYLTTNVPSSAFTPVMENFYGIDVLSAGGILVSGDNSETAATANPYLAKIYATATPTKVSQTATSLGAAGTLDTTFNPAGTNAGFMKLTTELQTTDFPSATIVTSLLQTSTGTYYIGGSTGSHSYVTLMSDDDVQQSGFGTSGLLTITSKLNLSSMLLTQNNNLLVAGGAGGSGSFVGWLQSYNPTTGVATVGFTSPTGGNVLDAHYAIAQQTNGRILVAGTLLGQATIIAYNSVTGALDTTFATSGIYTVAGYGAINSMIVDASNNIYFIANDTSNNAKVVKLNESGTAAAAGWTIPTVTANSTIATNNHVAFNQAGNIVAAAVNTTTSTILLISYNTSGALQTTLSLAVGDTAITTPYVTDILVDLNASPGKVIITGYDSNTSPNTPVIIRTTTALTALDTTFNTTGYQKYNTVSGGVTSQWYSAMINANGKITVGGYASALTTPYTMRVYGDDFIGQYSPSLTPLTAGLQGTVDTTFGSSGQVLLAGLAGAGALSGLTAQVVIPISTGQYYIAFKDTTPGASQVIRLTNGTLLDTSYGTAGFAEATTAGVYSMIRDAAGKLVLAGITGGAGWVNRLATDGSLDTTFNGGGQVSITGSTVATNVVQQTLSRYVVAGQQTGGNGALFGLTNVGVVDTTFGVNGIYDTGIATTVYAVIADQYDRLIIAYKNGSAVDLRRLTSSGQLDTTFGTSGTIAGAIPSLVDAVEQVFLTFDASGNIVVAAHTSTPAIAVKAYANTTGTSVVETQLNITGLTAPTMTDILATADGKILLAGYQSADNKMWVARVVNSTGAYALDISTSIPAAGNIPFAISDTIPGVMQFEFDVDVTVNARNLNSIAIYGNGQIAMVGIESDTADTPDISPFLSMAYDNPYTSQEAEFEGAKAVGTNDTTLGASSTAAAALGVVFYATATATNGTAGQVARAIALQDDAHILVAVDGGASDGATTPSNIYLKMFTTDGTPDTTFGTAGQRTVLGTYANQYVQDMVTFTTVAGVNKAILAGYTYNSTLPAANQYSSLLLQYNLDTHALDSEFGQFNGNAAGVAFGDGKQLFAVAQQSTGRIIAAGLSQDDLGLLLGYTAAGKLDTSFGNNGYQSSNTGTTGIYTQAIDTQNRVVIAYNNGSNTVILSRFLADGSGLDSSFTTPTSPITTLFGGNSNMRVAIDSSNNIVVAAVTNTGNEITFKKYSSSGGAPTSSVAVPYNLLGGASSASYVFAKLMIDTLGNVIAVCYDTDAEKILVLRLTSALALDTTNFNAPNGYLLYAIDGGVTSQVANDALIHPDGRIIIVGSEA